MRVFHRTPRPAFHALLVCLAWVPGGSAARAGVGPEAPRRTRDVIYGRKDGLALTMDIFHPPGKANGAGIVMIVSGSFRSSPEAIAPPFAEEVLKRGYTVFAVVHGSQPRYTVPE